MWAALLVAVAAAQVEPWLSQVDKLAGEVQVLADAARKALPVERKELARKLDQLLAAAHFERGLPAGPREELAVRVAWKLEPAVNRAVIALSGVETADDRASVRTRDLAASWYAARELCRRGNCTPPDCKVLLTSERPKGEAAIEAARDFDEVAGAACLALRMTREGAACQAAVRQQMSEFDAAVLKRDRPAAETLMARPPPPVCDPRDPWMLQRQREVRAAFDEFWPPAPTSPPSKRPPSSK